MAKFPFIVPSLCSFFVPLRRVLYRKRVPFLASFPVRMEALCSLHYYKSRWVPFAACQCPLLKPYLVSNPFWYSHSALVHVPLGTFISPIHLLVTLQRVSTFAWFVFAIFLRWNGYSHLHWQCRNAYFWPLSNRAPAHHDHLRATGHRMLHLLNLACNISCIGSYFRISSSDVIRN